MVRGDRLADEEAGLAPDRVDAVDALFTVSAGGVVTLAVHAQPGARTTGVVGRHGDALKVKVSAPADQGKANAAIGALLASTFGIATSDVSLVSGATGRAKRFRLDGVAPALVRARLTELIDEPAPDPGR